MTSPDVRAGTLYADVEGDTTGFGRDLQRKIDAAVAGVKARVAAEVDARRLQADLDAAVRTTKASITVPVTVDRRKLAADLKAAVLEAQRGAGTVTIDVDADTSAASFAIDEVARDRKATVEVDADVAEAETEIDAASRDRSTTIKANFDSSDLLKGSQAALGLMKFPAIAQGIAMAAGAVAQLGAGLISVVSAAAPALGLLAAMPAAGAAAAQGIGIIIGSFSGIGAAVKAMTSEQAQATTQGNSLAQAQEAAAQRVQAAEQSLADARRAADQQAIADAEAVANAREGVVEAEDAAARSLVSAEETLANAQLDALRAQQGLNAARQQAAADIAAYVDKLADASLNERSAKLGVESAEQNLNAVDSSATSTDLQRKQAKLAYDEAVQRLKEAREQQKQTAKEAAKANKQGVDGAKGVVAAQDAVNAANQRVLDSETALKDTRIDNARSIAKAEQGLADAERSAANSQIDSNERVANAVTALKQAQEAQAQASQKTTSGMSAMNVAMDNLSPAGQRFAKFLHDSMLPGLRNLRAAGQETFLPGVQAGLKSVLDLLPSFDKGFAATGTVLGNVVARTGKMMDTGPWRADFGTIISNNTKTIRALGGAFDPILRILRDLTVAAGPFVIKFAKGIEAGAKSLADFVHAQREVGQENASSGLSGFFARAYAAGAKLWDILKNLGGALYNIGKAAAPAGRILLDSLDKAVTKLRNVTGTTSGQNSLKSYFLNAVPGVQAMGRIINNLVLGIGKLGESPAVAKLLNQINTQLLPALFRALGKMQGTFGPAFVRLLTDILNVFTKLGGTSGGLTAAADALDVIFKVLNAILSIPGFSQGFSALFAVGGAAAGIGLVAGALGKLQDRLGKVISKVPGASKVFNKLKSAIGLSTDEIDKELPKDAKKTEALAGVEDGGGKAATTLGGRLVKGIKATGAAFVASGKKLDDWAAKMGGKALDAAKAFGGKVAEAATAAKAFTKQLVLSGAAALKTAATWVATKVAAAATAVAEAAAAAAAKVAAAAEWLLNAALDANPFVLIAVLIAALVVAVIELWKHSQTFRTIVTAAFHGVLVAVQFVWNWIKKNWPYLLAVLTGPIGLATVFILKHWSTIKGYFSDAFGWIKGKWQDFWNGLQRVGSSIFGAISSTISSVLSDIESAFRTTVSAIKSIWHTLREAIRAPVAFIVNTVYENGIRWAWNKVADLVHLPDLPDAHFAKGGVIPGRTTKHDSVRIWARPGEGVLVPEATQALGGARGIGAINSAYTGGATAPASKGGLQAFGVGGIVHHVLGGIGGAVVGGLGWVGGKALGLIRKGAADAISGLLGPVRSELNSISNGSAFTGALAAMFNSIIDSVIDKIRGSTHETPAANPQAHSGGGVISGPPSKLDTVLSWMRPGEGVLTPEATAAIGGAPAIDRLNRGPLSAVMSSARSAAPAAPIVVDRSVTFEEGAVQVNNPTAEPASDSINTRMRRLSALGVFGN